MSITSTNHDLTSGIIARLRQHPAAGSDPLRAEALEVFNKLGLPTQKHEEFKYTPLTRELDKNFRASSYDAPGSPPGSISPALPSVDAYRLVFVNGKFREDLSLIPSSGDVVIKPLSVALTSDQVATRHFSKIADFKNNAFAAWNAAGWNDGIFVHIPEGVVAGKPILFHYVDNGEGPDAIHITRNLVVCGKNAEVTVIEQFGSTAANAHFQNLVNEVVVGENASFNMYSIHDDPGARYQYTLTEIYQANHSRVNTYAFTLNGRLIRNNLHLIIDGEGIESHMYGLYLLEESTIADNHTVVDHRKPNSFSNELYKGIMGGSSKGVFNGKIYVRPQAQKTNAFQANRNILLTDKAAVNTKPQLEIWADDVKCSHGCTSGQLDEEAVFYLRSRGIHKETARAMMLYAFAGEVLDQVKAPGLHDYLDGIISERLHKNF